MKILKMVVLVGAVLGSGVDQLQAQQWQKSDVNGVTDDSGNCVVWNFEQQQIDDQTGGKRWGLIRADATISICTRGANNVLSGGPMLLINNTSEDTQMKMQLSETDANGSCLASKAYSPSFQVMGPMINREVPRVSIKRPKSKIVGKKICYRVVIK